MVLKMEGKRIEIK